MTICRECKRGGKGSRSRRQSRGDQTAGRWLQAPCCSELNRTVTRPQNCVEQHQGAHTPSCTCLLPVLPFPCSSRDTTVHRYGMRHLALYPLASGSCGSHFILAAEFAEPTTVFLPRPRTPSAAFLTALPKNKSSPQVRAGGEAHRLRGRAWVLAHASWMSLPASSAPQLGSGRSLALAASLPLGTASSGLFQVHAQRWRQRYLLSPHSTLGSVQLPHAPHAIHQHTSSLRPCMLPVHPACPLFCRVLIAECPGRSSPARFARRRRPPSFASTMMPTCAPAVMPACTPPTPCWRGTSAAP